MAGDRRGPLATESATAMVCTGQGCAVAAADPTVSAGLLFLVGGVHRALAVPGLSPLPAPRDAFMGAHFLAATARCGGGDAAAAVVAKIESGRVCLRPPRLAQQPPLYGDAGGDGEPRRTASTIYLRLCGGRGGGGGRLPRPSGRRRMRIACANSKCEGGWRLPAPSVGWAPAAWDADGGAAFMELCCVIRRRRVSPFG